MKALTSKFKLLGLALALCILLFLSCMGISLFRSQGKLTIGAKNGTEPNILGEIFAQLIEKKTDIRVDRRFNLDGTAICFHALRSGTIDAYFEYTGTALLHILKEPLRKGPLLPYVRKAFEERYGLLWMQPLGFSNQYGLIAKTSSGLQKISDIDSKLQIAFDPEFSVREELDLLREAYPKVHHSKLMDQVILFFSLSDGEVDVISGESTTGRLIGEELVLLEDDRKVLPNYEVSPILRKDALEKFPELKSICELLEGALSEEEVRKLNYEAEFESKDISQIARDCIKKKFNI